MRLCIFLLLTACLNAAAPELEAARNKQDRAALERIVGTLQNTANQRPSDANAQYQLAVAQSYAAEIAIETKDKGGAQRSAEAGIKAAEKAVQLDANKAEYHRILGTLCGQVIPANVLFG